MGPCICCGREEPEFRITKAEWWSAGERGHACSLNCLLKFYELWRVEAGLRKMAKEIREVLKIEGTLKGE